MGGKWRVRQNGAELEDSDRAIYALECFENGLAALDEFTNSFDRQNTAVHKALAQHNIERVLVNRPDLIAGLGAEKMDKINQLLVVPERSLMFSYFSDESFDNLCNCHLVKGLAYLNIMGDQGKAVEEFRLGALKGEDGAYAYYMRELGFPLVDDLFDGSEGDDGESDEDDVVTSRQATSGVGDGVVQQAQRDESVQLQQQSREMHAEDLRAQYEAARRAEEIEEKRRINSARKAERMAETQANIAAVTTRALAPVSENTKTWKILHVGKGAEDCQAILRKSQESRGSGRGDTAEMVRYLTLLNAIQSDDRTGRPKTLSGICLADRKTPIQTRRLFQSAAHSHRMVYTTASDESGNPVLTIYGLNGHDETIADMLKRRIAIEK